jgi:hypothetical protein
MVIMAREKHDVPALHVAFKQNPTFDLDTVKFRVTLAPEKD